MTSRKFFHFISYVQYPLLLIALYFAFKPYFNGLDAFIQNMDHHIKDFNKVLIFMGLGVSFATLQDTTKTQNKFSLKVYQNPKKSRIFIIYIGCLILLILIFGLFGYFISDNQNIQDLSTGFIIFGIGLIGMLKTAIEMAEFHKKDR